MKNENNQHKIWNEIIFIEKEKKKKKLQARFKLINASNFCFVDEFMECCGKYKKKKFILSRSHLYL